MEIEKCYDNSQLSTYQTCPFSYYLQYELGLKKTILDDTNASMHFGSAVHEYLEQFYSGKPTRLDAVQYEAPIDLPQYSRKALDFVCTKYFEKYLEKDRSLEILEAEKVAYLDIGEFKFIVKKDGAFRLSSNIFGLEHKTTKSLSYNYFDKYFLNSQISAQCQTTKNDYKQCSGILLNVIEVKLLKRKPTAKGYDGFLEVPEGFVTVKFQREYLNRTKEELDEWKANTLLWIHKIEESKQSGIYPRSTGLWGGTICSKCQYREICKVSVGKDLDESVVDLFYEKVDPYGYLK